MNAEIDDWNPDIKADTVFNKVLVDITDTTIKQNILNDDQVEKHAREMYKDVTLNEMLPNRKNKGEFEVEEEDLSDEEDVPYDVREGVKGQKLFEENLYDPLQDEECERWVDKTMKVDKGSQIVLSCPYCFTQVSYDSQRHEEYENQYRSMFVRNCRVDCTRTLQPNAEEPKKTQGKSKEQQILKMLEKLRAKGTDENMYENNEDDLDFDKDFEQICPKSFEYFFPVLCKNCDTEIAVYDVEGKIYHLFNVIPSMG